MKKDALILIKGYLTHCWDLKNEALKKLNGKEVIYCMQSGTKSHRKRIKTTVMAYDFKIVGTHVHCPENARKKPSADNQCKKNLKIITLV